jgi:hypothetical protein
VLAKKGAEIPKAQRGKSVKGRANLRNVDPKILDLLDLLSQKGYNVYATSGVRPGSQTAGGRESRHSAGQAMDVVFPDLGAGAYDAILKDPEVASYLLQNDITAINDLTFILDMTRVHLCLMTSEREPPLSTQPSHQVVG